jgi:hypothetical protein
MHRTGCALLALVLAAAPILRGQFCFRGQPKPACNTWWATEFGLAYEIGAEGGEWPYWTSEIGLAWNLDERNALGVTHLAGLSMSGAEEIRLGIKARYRRWLGSTVGLDVSAGTLYYRGDASGWFPDFIGYVGLSVRDYVGLGTQVEALSGYQGGVTWYPGLRVGSKPGLIAHALAAVAAVVAAINFAANYSS